MIGKWLRRVVQGYFNYHAVPGNLKRLSTLPQAKSVGHGCTPCGAAASAVGCTWDRFTPCVARYVPLVRVLHPYPNQRFCVMT